MATVTSAAQQPIRALRNWAARPAVATALILLYLAVVLLVLRGLDRRHLWFPTFSTLAFPAFVLSPFIVMSAPISRRLKTILIGGLILIAMPLVGIYDTSYLELAIQICIFTGLALGLNIVVGFAGLLDLGYIAFFAVGAYLWAMFTSQAPTVINISGLLVPAWTFPIFLIIGVGIAAVTGILLGLPVLRLRGDYLAIVTLGFGEMIRVLARNLDQPINFTNGAQGLHNVSPPPIPEIWTSFTSSTANLMGISLANVTPVAQQLLFYFVGVLIVAIVVVVARRLDDSPIGRAWTAIREDEVAAIAMGVPLVKMKLLAFAAGASFAGAIGVLYAAKQTFVSPESFSLIQSISILAMVIVGGLGGIRGVMLGAAVVTLLNLQVLKNMSLQLNALRQMDFVIFGFHVQNWPTQLEPAKYERLVFGLLLIIMMIFRPTGILPEPRRRIELQHDDVVTDEDDVSPAPGPMVGAN
ncbi:MAG: branched-chain amino acid ABC transporter permease [Chloroflexota bacterium]|nr:MAG: branched-chain amino acid ABC transporter permease [Chloroflexota bacterium]